LALKVRAIAEKTANKSSGLLFYAAPCTFRLGYASREM